MIKELKKFCIFFICLFFCLSCKTEVTKYIQSESEHTSIVWIGSFASADEIENLNIFGHIIIQLMDVL